jgi:hypothetical protein
MNEFKKYISDSKEDVFNNWLDNNNEILIDYEINKFIN